MTSINTQTARKEGTSTPGWPCVPQRRTPPNAHPPSCHGHGRLLNTVPHAKGVPKVATTLRDRAQFHAVASRLSNLTTLPVSPPLPFGEQSGALARMFDRIRAKVYHEAQLESAESANTTAASEAINPPDGSETTLTDDPADSLARVKYLESLYAVVLDRLKFVGMPRGGRRPAPGL